MTAKSALLLAGCLVSLLALVVPAHGNQVSLSTDMARSEATYVVQFVTAKKGRIDKIMVTLPAGTNAVNASLGRFLVGGEIGQDVDDEVYVERLSVPPECLRRPDCSTLSLDVKGVRNVKAGTTIFLELFHLRNPGSGDYTIQVQTQDRRGNVLETIALDLSITYELDSKSNGVSAGTGLSATTREGQVTLSVDSEYFKKFGDITGVYTPPGSGLTGGAASGEVTLGIAPGGVTSAHIADGTIGSADVNANQVQLRVTGICPASAISSIDANGGVVCIPVGDITAVIAGPGLTGGADTGAATLNVDTNLIQQRVTGTCPAGQSIGTIEADGSVTCRDGVTAITASAPLFVDGASTTPNLTLPNVIIGDSNTAIGATALGTNQGTMNTATGAGALFSNSGDGTGATGSRNTASGANALLFNTTGNDNTAIGVSALAGNVLPPNTGNTGSGNTASGAGALLNNTTGNNNTATGLNALKGGDSGQAGSQNTASGVEALFKNTAGSNNTASGFEALYHNITGAKNTATGALALLNNGTGNQNTASGFGALTTNNTGADNTASGANTLLNNSTGSSNTAIGTGALLANNANGAGNTVCANNASLIAGSRNTGVGIGALGSNIAGCDNTAIGASANVAGGNLTNATAIGAGARVDASDKVRIGNASVTVIEGQVGFTAVSDRNKKENFQPVDGEEVLKKLRGLTITSWNYIGQDPGRFRHYGPMAQDFYAAFGHDSVGTIGTPTTITSTDMDGILVIAVRALEQRTAELKAREARIKDLESRLEALERTMGTYVLPAKAEAR